MFLLGTMPDAVILCINYDDDVDYVIRTIKVIENLSNCKVIAICVFPFQYSSGWNRMNQKYSHIDNIKEIGEAIQKAVHIPVFSLNDENIDPIYAKVIDFFEERD